MNFYLSNLSITWSFYCLKSSCCTCRMNFQDRYYIRQIHLEGWLVKLEMLNIDIEKVEWFEGYCIYSNVYSNTWNMPVKINSILWLNFGTELWMPIRKAALIISKHSQLWEWGHATFAGTRKSEVGLGRCYGRIEWHKITILCLRSIVPKWVLFVIYYLFCLD